MTSESQSQPGTVVPSVTTQMQFPATNPATGAPLSPTEQLDMRMANPTWRAESQIVGAAAHAELARFKGLAAAEELGVPGVNPQEFAAELRAMGQTEQQISEELARFGLDVRSGVPQAKAPGEIPATSPERFRLPYDDRGTPETVEDLQLDRAMRGWLSVAGFDADRGSGFAEDVNKVEASREWTPEAIEAHQKLSNAALRSVWGADFDAHVQTISDFVDAVEAKQPGLIEFFEARPYVLREPIVAQQILNLAQRRVLGQ